MWSKKKPELRLHGEIGEVIDESPIDIFEQTQLQLIDLDAIEDMVEKNKKLVKLVQERDQIINQQNEQIHGCAWNVTPVTPRTVDRR